MLGLIVLASVGLGVLGAIGYYLVRGAVWAGRSRVHAIVAVTLVGAFAAIWYNLALVALVVLLVGLAVARIVWRRQQV